MRGWKGEPRRHALAARGIPTRQRVLRAEGVVTDIAEFPSSIHIDYSEPEEVFALFWASSLSGDFSNFDFDRAFEEAAMRINNQLRAHGLLGTKEYQFWLEDMYPWPMAIDDFVDASGVFLDWQEEDVRVMIWELVKGTDNAEIEHWDSDVPLPEWVAEKLVEEQSDDWKRKLVGEHRRGGRRGAYPDLMEIYKLLESPPTGLQEKIVLMDRIIHAQHIGGSIWEDVDVEGLRSRVESASRRARVGEA